MQGLMMDLPLLLSNFIEHAGHYDGETELVGREIDGSIHRTNFATTRERCQRLGKALARLGVTPETPVATLAWNTYRHFEMFYAVPGMGAVLHTINPRLFHEQIVYIVNHAEDRVIFIDPLTLPIVETLAGRLPSVIAYVMMIDRAAMPQTTLANLICYEDLVSGEGIGEFSWPVFDERRAATICYTSGTTGNPKGVVYSHRALVLQTMIGASFMFLPGHRDGQREVMFPMAPLFHGNAWNMPFLACYTGSKLVLPGRNYEPEKLYELIEGEGVTITCGVPSFWLILLDWLQRTGKRFSTLRLSLSSGSAPPRSMVETLDRDYGVSYVQAWGMTEALMATMPTPKPGSDMADLAGRVDLRMKSGRIVCGVKARVVDDAETTLPEDGQTLGHLRVKGPWIASGYLKGVEALDAEGYLITGDMGVIDRDGYVTIRDRAKDVIKSGGEWISSIELENIAASHPAVLQAAVIAVPHAKWQERPLLLIVRREGATLDAEAMLAHIRPHVASWWMPDAVEFIDAFPMTATGKIHKLTLREQYREYATKI